MAGKGRPETYAPIHKGLRANFFMTSIKAGKIDNIDRVSLNTLLDEYSTRIVRIGPITVSGLQRSSVRKGI